MSDGVALIINDAGLEAESMAAEEPNRIHGRGLHSCDAGAGASMPSSRPASATPAGERLKLAEMEERLHEQAAQIRALMARIDERVAPYDPDGASLRSSREKVVEEKAVVTQGNPFAHGTNRSLVKVGKPFHLEQLNHETNGELVRKVPESIYTCVLVMIMQLSCSCKDIVNMLIFCGLPLCLTATVQNSLAFYLFKAIKAVDGDLAADCSSVAELWLQLVALGAFVGLAVRELIGVFETHMWLQMFKTVKKHEMLLLQRYELEVEGMRGDKIMSTVHRPLTGITRIERGCFYLLLLLWFLTSFTVLVAGSGAVLRSSNRFDLVLNTTAATFVLELDEMIYHLLVPSTVRGVTSCIPPFNASRYDASSGKVCSCRSIGFFFYSEFVFVLVALLMVPLYITWCPQTTDTH